jgi:threonine synthase
MFNNADFRDSTALTGVNSINWARILAQTVYYFTAAVALGAPAKRVSFTVPTGNFGDIFAGYLAKRMGLPIRRLVLATNENNILSRFVRNGDYSTGNVVETLSPSMDIQVASNFERYLFYLYGGNSERVTASMESFSRDGRLSFSKEEMAEVGNDFLSLTVDRDQTIDTIRSFHALTGYILDPHTAVGVKAGRELSGGEAPVVCLATAHPAKFGEAVHSAIGRAPEIPPSLAGIEALERRCEIIDADTEAVKKYVEGKALLGSVTRDS